jgi:hypothetical protein
MARVIALTALVALGLSGTPVHEPVHTWHRQYPVTVTERDTINTCPLLTESFCWIFTDLMVVPDEVVDQELPWPLLDNAAGSMAWRYTREPVRRGGP